MARVFVLARLVLSLLLIGPSASLPSSGEKTDDIHTAASLIDQRKMAAV